MLDSLNSCYSLSDRKCVYQTAGCCRDFLLKAFWLGNKCKKGNTSPLLPELSPLCCYCWCKKTTKLESFLVTRSLCVLWPIPSLTTMSLTLLHFFCVVFNWEWISVSQRGTPFVAIGSKCLLQLWRDVEARHVTLDDVFIAQFGSVSSTRRVIEFAAKDILGQATIFHTMDMA